eukprot:Hpha_TRINITY_DN15515_c1_g2::TRINITY_DN15515_c1_g2_i1::g.106021::m.106021
MSCGSELWARLVVFAGGLLTAYGAVVVAVAYIADTPDDIPFAAGLSSDQVKMCGWLMTASGVIGALSTCTSRRFVIGTQILLLLVLNGCLRSALRTQARFDLDRCAQDSTHDAIIQRTTYIELFPGTLIEVCQEMVQYVDLKELDVCSTHVHRVWTWAAAILTLFMSLFLGCSFAYCSTTIPEDTVVPDIECDQVKQLEEFPQLDGKNVVYL